LKPFISTVTWYVPAGKVDTVKNPSALVTVFRVSPDAEFLTATVAPDTTAPLPSLTDPLRVANIDWAEATGKIRSNAAKRLRAPNIRLIGYLLTIN
jgi:hypothetical protein